MRAPIPALIVALSAILLVVAHAPEARAQDASEARALFEQGVEASQDDRWAQAVDYFRRSRMIMERPSAVFNTGVALHRMGRVREALADVEQYLEMTSASEPGEEERYAQAEQLRGELRAHVSVLTLVLSPADAQVEVDGRPREGEGAERAVDLDPGAHAIRISAVGHGREQFEVRLAPGEQVRREVTLEVAEVGDEPDPDPDPMPAPEPGDEGGLGGLGVAGIVIAAVGAGAGVGALISGLIAQDTYDSLLARCPGGTCPAGSEDDLSSGEALAWVSTALLGVTIIGIGVGVALLIVDLVSGDSSDDRAARLRVVPSEGGAALRLDF